MRLGVFLLLCGFASLQKADAQVPVEKEAHHKVVLENVWVRVLEGLVPSHDTTPPHIHAANSVVVFLTKCRFGIQIIGQQPVVADISPGDIRYLAYGDKPVNHIVWDQSDSALRFLVVELKRPAGDLDTGRCPILSRPDLQLRWQQRQVIDYDWTLASGQAGEIPGVACPRVLIVPGTGAFRFFPPGEPVKFKNSDGRGTRLILLEIR